MRQCFTWKSSNYLPRLTYLPAPGHLRLTFPPNTETERRREDERASVMEKLRQLRDTMGTSRPSFDPVRSEESLLSNEQSRGSEDAERSFHSAQRPRKHWKYWALGITLFCFYSASMIALGAFSYKPSDRQCSDQLSMWCK